MLLLRKFLKHYRFAYMIKKAGLITFASGVICAVILLLLFLDNLINNIFNLLSLVFKLLVLSFGFSYIGILLLFEKNMHYETFLLEQEGQTQATRHFLLCPG